MIEQQPPGICTQKCCCKRRRSYCQRLVSSFRSRSQGSEQVERSYTRVPEVGTPIERNHQVGDTHSGEEKMKGSQWPAGQGLFCLSIEVQEMG